MHEEMVGKQIELLSLFETNLVPHIKEVLSKVWIPPYEAEPLILNIIEKIHDLADYRVVISGEVDNVSLYLIGGTDIWVYTPFANFKSNVLLKGIPNRIVTTLGKHLCIVERNENLVNRLILPKVILINPSVKDVFPSPRLALSISSLAAYLRKYQKADVRLLDMQVGLTIEGIINEVRKLCPDLVGISMSFGHLPLGLRIIDRLFSGIGIEKKPLVVAGNVVSSFGHQALLTMLPDLLVCHGEGERTITDIIDYVRGDKKNLSEVSGITYMKNGELRRNPTQEIDMDDSPLPAMDSVSRLVRDGGALTMETSRGCYYSNCTFCPRTHKAKRWKGMSAQLVLRQLKSYDSIFRHFDIESRIYMADEEFIGWSENEGEVKRITKIMEEVVEENLKIHFEQDVRVDQIYDPNKNRDWHVERMKMLISCKKAGLDRMLVGVESGSDTVLKRFNKNITSVQSVTALRLLTSLGIRPRITFITFDPLMNFTELKEDVLFLEREDAFMRCENLSETPYSELFQAVHDNNFVKQKSLRRPLYENVAYMLVNLEVLIDSHYVDLVKNAEQIYDTKLLAASEPDYNMARFQVRYLNETIGEIAHGCQKWIDRHFALDYCLKGIYKTAGDQEREILFRYRANYRKLSFLLLKSLVWILDTGETMSLENNSHDLSDIMSDLSNARKRRRSSHTNQIVFNVMDLFNEKMKSLVSDIEDSIRRREIRDSNLTLRNIIDQWKQKKEWSLINPWSGCEPLSLGRGSMLLSRESKKIEPESLVMQLRG